MKNKICIYFESYYVGGLDTFTINLINNWPKQESIWLLCNKSHSGSNYLKTKVTNPNCEVEIHNMSMVQDWGSDFKNVKLKKMIGALSRYIHIPYYILFGYKTLKMNRFTHLYVINGGYPACLSSRCISISWWIYTRKKSIHNFHNYAVKTPIYFRFTDSIIDKLLLKATSYFVSVSKDCSESLRIRSTFQDVTNITYVYNGISDDKVLPSFDLREELSLSSNAKILIMLATYEERKGHKHIIDVFTKVSNAINDAYLLFLGYGADNEINIVKQYAELKGVATNVKCLEFKKNAMEYLAQSDMVLIGSQSFESFGLTAVEAMKYEKVVISTNTGGLKEVIANGEGGYVFNILDIEHMASKIIELFNDDAERARQGKEGRKRYLKNFTADRMADEYRNLLIKP